MCLTSAVGRRKRNEVTLFDGSQEQHPIAQKFGSSHCSGYAWLMNPVSPEKRQLTGVCVCM